MQQSGLNDMKLLQQPVMFKQLQEFQLQQFSGSGLNDPPSFSGETQMKMNLVQRGTQQVHAQQDTSWMSPHPLQLGVTLCGAPVASIRSDMNPCSEVLRKSVYFVAKNGSDKDQKITSQSQGFASFFSNAFSQGHSFMSQGLHEKTALISDSVLGLNSDPVTVKDREDLSGMQQKAKQSSQGSVQLDPIEEKILYHMDDNVWDSSFARNNLENGSAGFSWSALMQIALEGDTGTLDGNGNSQIPNIRYSLSSSLDNVCGNSFGILQHVQSHGDKASMLNSSRFVSGQISSDMSQNFVAETSVQDHAAHMQLTSNLSLVSQPKGEFERSYDLCVKAAVGQNQLEVVSNEVPMMLPVLQQKPSGLYNAPISKDIFSEGIFASVSYFPKSTYNAHQKSAILQQPQRYNLTTRYLRTDNVPDVEGIASAEGDKPHEQSSSMKRPTDNEPGMNSNLKLIASAETDIPSLTAEKQEDQTRKTLCLHSFSETPNGATSVCETQSNIIDVMTGHSSQLPVGKSLDNLHVQNYAEKLGNATLHSNSGLSESAMQSLENVNHSMAALRPKKRRCTAYGLWPWQKEVMQGSDRHHSISVSEQVWARATNRLFEKMEDSVGTVEPMPHSKRRIISTTHLMQQLLRPAPAFTFSGNSAIHYESIAYFVSRIALGDACSLASCWRDDLLSDLHKIKITAGHQQYSEIVEAFIKKIQKLESEFQRLQKTTSIIDIRVEIQDLERFAVMNRLAKFYSRAQADSSGHSSSSSSSSSATSKSVRQRYVVALPLPRTLPEEVHCLSL